MDAATEVHLDLWTTHLPEILDDRFEALGPDFEKLWKVPYHGADQKRLDTDFRPDNAERRRQQYNSSEAQKIYRYVFEADGDTSNMTRTKRATPKENIETRLHVQGRRRSPEVVDDLDDVVL